MKLTLRGKGNVVLSGSDFMTSGGEAKIYKRNKIIYKIYHDPKDMIPDSKIEQLQEIKESNVLIPKDIILDSKGVRVGFTMDNVSHVTHLCKLFTNSFINQNNVSNDTIIDLVKHMQDTIFSIHGSGCIQVDGNELNYLVDEKKFKTCYFIDVNSYQTKSFPATVIMPSIRDWSAKVFNELTDWYSFAIIACQLFVGIHPFKGKHQDFKRHDMEKRMKANISIFNKNTKTPKSVRDFGNIPTNYMSWFLNIFEEGKRELPPSTTGPVNPQVQYIILKSTDNFEIKQVDEFEDIILDHSNWDMIPVTRTKKYIHIGGFKHRVNRNVKLIHTPKKQIPVMIKIDNDIIEVKSLDRNVKATAHSLSADDLMVVDNTLYVFREGDLIEMTWVESMTQLIMATKAVWPISKNSSQLFTNVIVQDIMGSKYISIPNPLRSQFYTHQAKFLDDYKVLDGKYENGVAVFSVYDSKQNEYGLVVMTGADKKNKNERYIKTIGYSEVNFVTLDNGIALLIYDDKMEIFNNLVTSSKVKVIKDKELSSDMKLCKRGMQVRFHNNTKLYNIKMK